MKKQRIQNLVKPSINKISKYIPGESKISGNKKIIKLSSNESPFKLPKSLFSKLKIVLEKSNLYPDGDSRLLKKTISEVFKLNSEQIICGNGSDDILSVICQTFGREKGEVICNEFGFIYYPIISRAAGAEVITAKSNGVSISCDNILKKISNKTNLIFLANPNNPTGSIIFRDELESFINKIPKNIILVLDGAYSEFIVEKNYTDGLDLVKKFPNLIITRTFSKIFALAGLRLGWAYSNKEIIDLLEKVRGPFNVNSIAQKMGSIILRDKKFLKKSIDHNLKWQKKLPRIINEIGLQAYETYTNFVLVKVNKRKFDKKKIIEGLQKKRIIVRELNNYGLMDYFRVSIGTNEELNYFIKILKSLVKKN